MGLKNIRKRVDNRFFVYILLLFIAIWLLAFVDFIVLEEIYHPISAQYGVPWSAFDISESFPIQKWQIAFLTLGVFMFVLLGIAARSWRLSVSGIILFATGWEDIFYYLIQFKGFPSELPWLDYSPLMTLSRFVTRTEHVSNFGVLISALFGILIILLISLPIINNSKRKIKK